MRDYTTLMPYLTHCLEPSGSSVQMANFSAGIRDIRIHAIQAVWIAIGDNPTAAPITTGNTGESVYLPAGATEYFHVKEGTRLALIEAAATAGLVTVTEMTR